MGTITIGVDLAKSVFSACDRNDAEAIATAARQGNMRFVPVKDVDQQVRLSWHRVREGYKVESLAIGNRIRGSRQDHHDDSLTNQMDVQTLCRLIPDHRTVR